tara:strand:- start:571 stop:984 length:414 start_codon:yes stop_codon:yes gene_type:complete
MAALTQDVDRKEKEGKLIASPVAAATEIFQGALTMHDSNGLIANATPSAGDSFAGVAYERVDNSAGVASEKSIRNEKHGSFLMTGAGFTQADVGLEVRASDNDTVQIAALTNSQVVGRIVEFVSATQVRVKIDGYAV